MTLSLTKEQIGERLIQPQRARLLTLAIQEDIRSILPLCFTDNSEENDRIMCKALSKLIDKLLLRAIILAYDETLD